MSRRFSRSLAGLTLAGLAVLGCDNHGPVMPYDFAVHRTAQDFEVQTGMNSSVDIDEVVVEMLPLITLDDIEWYDWDEHMIELTDRGRDRLAGQEVRQPFVVTVQGERVYGGVFWSGFMSQIVTGITFDLAGVQSGDNMLWVSYVDRGGDPVDLRDDSRVRGILEAAGKLR